MVSLIIPPFEVIQRIGDRNPNVFEFLTSGGAIFCFLAVLPFSSSNSVAVPLACDITRFTSS